MPGGTGSRVAGRAAAAFGLASRAVAAAVGTCIEYTSSVNTGTRDRSAGGARRQRATADPAAVAVQWRRCFFTVVLQRAS
jgi:hypothetical protein